MLEERRATTLDRLGTAYAHGHLSAESLEHRLADALAAAAHEPLDATLFGLPGRRTPRVTALDLGEVLLPGTDGREAWTLGRSRRCDVRLGDPTVSARHAHVWCRGGRWSVVDLGSTNGTWVNGLRVERAVLRRGDTLLLGGLAAHLTA